MFDRLSREIMFCRILSVIKKLMNTLEMLQYVTICLFLSASFGLDLGKNYMQFHIVVMKLPFIIFCLPPYSLFLKTRPTQFLSLLIYFTDKLIWISDKYIIFTISMFKIILNNIYRKMTFMITFLVNWYFGQVKQALPSVLVVILCVTFW